MFYAFVYYLLKPLFKLFFRLEARGAENIPADGSTVFASNHKSYLDPIVVAIPVYPRQLRFMAKAELWKIPVLGRVVEALGAFPVHRGGADRKAIIKSLEILRSGRAMLIFPEGARIRRPGLGDAHRGMTAISLKTGAKIVPVGISGSDGVMPEGARLPRFPKIVVDFGKPIEVSEHEGSQEDLTRKVMTEIGRLMGLESPEKAAAEVRIDD